MAPHQGRVSCQNVLRCVCNTDAVALNQPKLGCFLGTLLILQDQVLMYHRFGLVPWQLRG